jgi:glycosyltransferase involved in cell wall biosynthesis
MVYLGSLGSRASTIAFKYVGQWLRTARLLRQERPDAVFVMTPPLFAALPAFWYAYRRGARVVLDAHTAAFLHPRWQRLQWLQRAMCRTAATTIVHNEHLAEVVRSWNAHATVVADVPVIFPDSVPFARPDAFSVAVVCSFNYDEPLPAIIDAARALPEVRFFVTGDPRFLPREMADTMPANMTLTGFLSTAEYGGLISGVDAVLTLTTRNHTMLRGAYEAIYQGTPVIISDWPLLREGFPEGAIHVDNTAASIADAVRRMRDRHAQYRSEANQLKHAKLERFADVRRRLVESIAAR